MNRDPRRGGATAPTTRIKSTVGKVPRRKDQAQHATSGEDLPTVSSDAEYIRDTLIELRWVADRANLNFLAYLLDMAYEEANIRSQATSVR